MFNPMSVVPMVVDNSGRGERAYDIYSLLLKERIIFLGSGINDQVANVIVAQLLYLDSQDPESPIRLYVNSPGGVIYSGMGIYDTMQAISAPVSTVVVGLAASFGTVVLAAGAKGMRYALPNSTIHMHQPLVQGGVGGQTTDVLIQAAEMQRLKIKLNGVLAHHTGQDLDRIEKDTDRDVYLSAEEAKEYGLVDEVLSSPQDLVG